MRIYKVNYFVNMKFTKLILFFFFVFMFFLQFAFAENLNYANLDSRSLDELINQLIFRKNFGLRTFAHPNINPILNSGFANKMVDFFNINNSFIICNISNLLFCFANPLQNRGRN